MQIRIITRNMAANNCSSSTILVASVYCTSQARLDFGNLVQRVTRQWVDRQAKHFFYVLHNAIDNQ